VESSTKTVAGRETHEKNTKNKINEKQRQTQQCRAAVHAKKQKEHKNENIQAYSASSQNERRNTKERQNKQEKCDPSPAESTKIHGKTPPVVHVESLTSKRFREEIRVLKMGGHMNNPEFSPRYPFTDGMMTNVNVFAVRGSDRVAGQVKRTDIVLVHDRPWYRHACTFGKVRLHEPRRKTALLTSSAIATHSASVEERVTLRWVLDKNGTHPPRTHHKGTRNGNPVGGPPGKIRAAA